MAVAGLLLLAPSAGAAEDLPTMIVVDRSGSMGDPTGTYGNSAVPALLDFVSGLEDATPLGLLSFGNGCGGIDGEVGARAGDYSHDRLRVLIEQLPADGGSENPLIALAVAADSLGDHGSARILLITDGDFSCPEPAEGWCAAIDSVVPDGVRLDVINYPASAYSALLDCLATAGGGEYSEASTPEQLEPAIDPDPTIPPALGWITAGTVGVAAVAAVRAVRAPRSRSGQRRLVQRSVEVTPHPAAISYAPPVPTQRDNSSDPHLNVAIRPRLARWQVTTQPVSGQEASDDTR